MGVVIRLSSNEERRALPILLRHSPGTILPDRTYVISPEAASALKQAGIRFTQIGSDADAPRMGGVPSGERI